MIVLEIVFSFFKKCFSYITRSLNKSHYIIIPKLYLFSFVKLLLSPTLQNFHQMLKAISQSTIIYFCKKIHNQYNQYRCYRCYSLLSLKLECTSLVTVRASPRRHASRSILLSFQSHAFLECSFL